ncbi:MAG TPA: glycerate kinase [Chloroflexia bacterium]|nr:glycerate kinase [Chloroflexia bacterium]
MDVLAAALSAADPFRAVDTALKLDEEVIQILASVQPDGDIFVVGAGKAGTSMAVAVEKALGDRVTGGLVIVKDGYAGTVGAPLRHITLREGAHPVPDARGVEATRELISLIESAGERDLVICLISGGGSALLTLPGSQVTLEDVQAVTALLLKSGATINELNAVRKHLSRESGGQLARIAAPARVLSLILSDVTGSPLDVIASGPTVPDPTTYADALAVLALYDLLARVPANVLAHLEAGKRGDLPETPKDGDPLFSRVTNKLVASNVQAVESAAMMARHLGFNTSIISTSLEGEARVVGADLARLARGVAEHGTPVQTPACLLFGGETTVTVRGSGVGGRNTELALSAAIHLSGLGPRVLVASLATDGGDGTSPSAGGLVDGTTVERGAGLGLDVQSFLDNNDSYSYLAAVGDVIMTGPTGTNVNDIIGVFAFG